MTAPSARALPRAWTRATIVPADWTVPLPDAAVHELLAVRDELRRAPVPTFLLDPRDFALDACRAAMAEVRRVTQSGPMFGVLDRLPMDEVTREEAIDLYWLLSSLLARPVAQKLNGQMFYRRDGHRREAQARLGHPAGHPPTSTCASTTTIPTTRRRPSSSACSACIRRCRAASARSMSVATVHDALQQRHPELISRLYRPFWYDRHAEHQPGEPTTFAAPMFERGADGTIKARLALSGSMRLAA